MNEYCCLLILPPFSSRIHSLTLSFYRKRVPVAAVPVADDEEELFPDEENMISASEDEVKAAHTESYGQF